MSNRLPLNFRKSPEVAVTYDFNDINSGLGFVRYYGYTSDDAAASTKSYNLTEKIIYSSTMYTTKDTASTSTYNFDSPIFQTSKLIKGTAILNFAYNLVTAHGYSSESMKFQLQKVNGATTTNLCSEFTFAPQNAGDKSQAVVKLDLTKTNINAGEKIRLVVKLISDDAAHTMDLAHDPAGRYDGTVFASTDNVSTALTVDIPFAIDI